LPPAGGGGGAAGRLAGAGQVVVEDQRLGVRDQRVLGGEVVREDAGGDAQRGADVAEGDLPEAALGDGAGGGDRQGSKRSMAQKTRHR
jgi:hypothetical protein